MRIGDRVRTLVDEPMWPRSPERESRILAGAEGVVRAVYRGDDDAFSVEFASGTKPRNVTFFSTDVGQLIEVVP